MRVYFIGLTMKTQERKNTGRTDVFAWWTLEDLASPLAIAMARAGHRLAITSADVIWLRRSRPHASQAVGSLTVNKKLPMKILVDVGGLEPPTFAM